MRTRIVIICTFLLLITQGLFAQDYKDCYKLVAKANYALWNDNDPQRADSIYKRALKYKHKIPHYYLWASFAAGKMNTISKFRRYILQAARLGLGLDYIEENYPYIDSILIKEKLKGKYEKIYSHSVRRNIETSCKIKELFTKDQLIRRGSHFIKNDTSSVQLYQEFFYTTDSNNFFELLTIINDSKFDMADINYDAQFGLYIILSHVMTSDFALPYRDTIFSFLLNQVHNGILCPDNYASSIDRYYMTKYRMNYYCQFYNDELPLFDAENIDSRREEIGLKPLYFEFMQHNNVKNLPKEYLYDTNIVRQW